MIPLLSTSPFFSYIYIFLSRPMKQFIGRGFINSQSNYGLDGRGHIFGSFINLRSTRYELWPNHNYFVTTKRK